MKMEQLIHTGLHSSSKQVIYPERKQARQEGHLLIKILIEMYHFQTIQTRGNYRETEEKIK